MFNASNLFDRINSDLRSMPFKNGIENYATVDVMEVERLKAQGWIVESTRIVLNDIICYNLVRLV